MPECGLVRPPPQSLLPPISVDIDRDLGAVLTQEMPSGEQPIFFQSRKLSKLEQNYAVIEWEALALWWAVDQFKYYLWVRQFTVVNNHAPLQFLNRMKDSNPRFMC